jgi:site-specific DNA-cytosine methylase
MRKPVVIDLCCGLGGWTQGFLAEGWDAIGFDIEKHEYGDKRYPADLILKDIRQLCGYDLRAVNPALVVASPPCQNYSYMAMPWKRAKAMAQRIREDESGDAERELNALYNACFRIAREIGCPIVLENVKGAQPWVGRANAHYGSYYLWGDVGDVGGRVVRADVSARFGQYVRPSRAQKFNPDGTAHGQGSWFAVPSGLNF